MENTSYALYIAAGVLIGIVILSLIVFRWRQIGFFESSKDEAVAVKNKADFNSEYEAYNKGLMYGTDVLSCLNKAQNNNQKYVYNNYYGTETETMGKESREEYFIDVEIKIKSTLCDSVKAYYKDEKGKYQRVIGLGNGSVIESNYGDKVFDARTGNRFDVPDIYYYYFQKGKLYQRFNSYTNIMWDSGAINATLYKILTQGVKYGTDSESSGLVKTKMTAGTYNLLTSEDTSTITKQDETAKLAALISTVSLKEQTIYNSIQPSVFDKTDWWYCTWTTAASDFKSRKFKCTGVKYNENHGYIEKISFEEL